MKPQDLSNAQDATLDFILAEGDKKLSAQQALALAADGRATGLLGAASGLGAAAAALAASVTGRSGFEALYEGAVAVSVLAALSALCAIMAARPVDFFTAGWRPAKLAEDVQAKLAPEDIKRSIAAHLNDRIEHNEKVLTENARTVLLAMTLLVMAPVAGLLCAQAQG